jgi:predicted metal-dependent hydrolase
MPARDDRREALRRLVEHWAPRLKVKPRIVRIQHMTRKWGSCSTSGIITLAADLIDQDPGFQDFVTVHELLHLRVPNHGKLFKALLGAHVPDWRRHDRSRERHGSHRG